MKLSQIVQLEHQVKHPTQHKFKKGASKQKNGFEILIGIISKIQLSFIILIDKQVNDICAYIITLISSELF